MVTTVILCGGRGTRVYPHTVEVPKPLLEVDGRPVLHHVVEIFAGQGFTDLVLATGYLGEQVAAFARTLPAPLRVEVLDTGEDTNTGGRVWRCREAVGEEFFVTYADGLGDVDLTTLLEFHRSHPGAATLTTVALPSPYGTLELADGGRVDSFREKPSLPDHRINAGFFVFDRRAFELWEGEDLEREVLPRLSSLGELYAYDHHGFWKSMDTYKEALALTELCQPGPPPWLAAGSPQPSDADRDEATSA